jgi:hypothetical protein
VVVDVEEMEMTGRDASHLINEMTKMVVGFMMMVCTAIKTSKVQMNMNKHRTWGMKES